MSNDDLRVNTSDLNNVLSCFNSFILEQADFNDYDLLVKGLLLQMDRLLKPIAIIFNEYDHDNSVLSVKEIKANKGILDLVIKTGGRKILSTVTPVDDQMYQEITKERVFLRNTLSELTAGAVPEIASKLLGKTLNIKCGLGFAFMHEDRLYGTMVVMLDEMPPDYYLEIFRSYAHFTALSLKRIKSDQALIKSELKYRRIAENISDVVWVTDAELNTVYVSPSVEKLLGESVDYYLTRSLEERFPPDSLNKLLHAFQEEMEIEKDPLSDKNRSRVVEAQHYKADGSIFWVSMHISILRDNRGDMAGLQGVTRDITDRKQAEEALKNSEQELRTIADNMTDVVAMADVEGRFTYLSESNYQLTGYRPSELLGKSIFELIHEEDLSALGVIFQVGDVVGRKDARVEYRVRHKKGGYVWVETIGSLMLDDNGQPSGALFVSRDISDRKQAQEQIERLAQIADSAPSSIVIHDYEGNLFYANEHTFHLYGYIKEEFMKLNLRDISAPESAELIPARMKDIKEKGKAEFEVRHVRKDGSTVPMQVYVKQTEWFGKPALLSVSTDITERKKAEETLRVSEEKYRQITDNISDVVWVTDTELNTVYVSPSVEKMFGESIVDHMNRSLEESFSPDSLNKLVHTFQEEIEIDSFADVNRSHIVEAQHYKADGSTVWVSMNISVLRDNDGNFAGLQGVTRDITERKRIESDLSFIKDVITSSSSAIATSDLEGHMTYGNPFFQKLWGFIDQEEFLGKPFRNFWMLGDHEENIIRTIQAEGIWEGELKGIKQDGSLIDVQVSASIVLDNIGNPIAMTSTSIDITDRKKAEEEIRYMSFHDQLTDLYNRHYFEACEEELKDIPVLSVIMTDVNGLKLINDTYGHGAGDEMLKKYADLLRESFKQSDLIFRWGGDEFVIILKNTKEAKSWELCNRLKKHCGETFVKDIPLSISVGISSKLQGGDIDKAIKEAENMMYKNKLTESKSSKSLIMKTLQQALAEKSFETKEHIDRITTVGRQFGGRLGLSLSELSKLETLIMLHDIGKINIDSHILLKETALTDEEWVEIKKHPEVGYRITRTAEEFAYIAEEILAHHERWDGKGYPQGLEGENIPHLARVLNIIDSYDVMSNGRPYKKKMSVEEIVEEVNSCSGKQFDPELAKEFIACLKEGAMAENR